MLDSSVDEGYRRADPAMWLHALTCGYSEPGRSRRLLAMLTAYIDESGSGQGPIFILAGFVATTAQWDSFTHEWQAALDAPPAIPFFKFKQSKSANRLKRLVSVVEKSGAFGISSSLPATAFAKILQPHFAANRASAEGKAARVLGTAYAVCFFDIIVQTVAHLLHSGSTEPLDFIFDENTQHSFVLSEHWPILRAMMPRHAREVVPNPITFRDDKKVLPLQAADMYAGSFRRHVAEKVKTRGMSEDNSALMRLYKLRAFDSVFDAARMRQYASDYFAVKTALSGSAESQRD